MHPNLKANELQGNTTFVDSDDLNDLTRLFSYVGQDQMLCFRV